MLQSYAQTASRRGPKGTVEGPSEKRNVRLDAIPDTAVYNTVIKGKPQRIDSRIIAVWKNPRP